MMLSTCLLGLLVAECMSAIIPETKESKLSQASNDLAFDLLRSYKNEKNVFISPFSISTALASVYLGTEGKTAEDMRKVLHYDQYGLSPDEVHMAFQSILTKLGQNSEDYQLSTYNSAFVQKNYSIMHDYKQALRQYYSVDIESVDFIKEGERVKAMINDAVETATKGKIKNFLERAPSKDTKLFLLNAVYFLGNWKHPFNPDLTTEDLFYNNGITARTIPMMYRDGRYRFSFRNGLNSSIVILPYKGDNSASMVIVLPDKKTGVAELESKVTHDSLNKALSTLRSGRIVLTLPKFSVEYSANLVEPLSKLGLTDLFGLNANLSRIAGKDSRLRVSKIVHKAVIDVNEVGSEAAAATGVEIIEEALPPSFSVSHPFLYFIREETTGMILFSGRVDEL